MSNTTPKRKITPFSFDFEPIYKLDTTLPHRRPLKSMYMCMYALRRSHVSSVLVGSHTYHISAHYAWERTFRRGTRARF